MGQSSSRSGTVQYGQVPARLEKVFKNNQEDWMTIDPRFEVKFYELKTGSKIPQEEIDFALQNFYMQDVLPHDDLVVNNKPIATTEVDIIDQVKKAQSQFDSLLVEAHEEFIARENKLRTELENEYKEKLEEKCSEREGRIKKHYLDVVESTKHLFYEKGYNDGNKRALDHTLNKELFEKQKMADLQLALSKLPAATLQKDYPCQEPRRALTTCLQNNKDSSLNCNAFVKAYHECAKKSLSNI